MRVFSHRFIVALVVCGAACKSPAPRASATDAGSTHVPPTNFLVVDSNRDGVVDVAGTSDDSGKNVFDAQHGAVVLANIDDDDGDGIPDATTDIVDGDSDTADLSPVALRAWADAPSGTSAVLSVDALSAPNVRLFRVNGPADKAASYSLLGDPTQVAISTADLVAGAMFAVEAETVVKSDAAGAWKGRIQLSLQVTDAAGKVLATDAALLRVAPVLFQYNTAATTSVYYTDGDPLSTVLANGIQPVCVNGAQEQGITLPNADFDQWTQDFFDIAYMSKPGPNHTFIGMDIVIRSAEPDRPAGGDVLTKFLGPDFGALYIYSEPVPQDPSSDGYSMNSFGDWDVIPPYTKGGTNYPLGRNIWGMGSTPAEQPDQAYQAFVRAQAVQPAVNVDSSWLTVGHVDEFFSWVKTNTPRGWGMLVAKPSQARQMLLDLQTAGHGSDKLFVGKQVDDYSKNPDANGNYPLIDAAESVDQILADADLMAVSQLSQTAIDSAVAIMKTEVGLTDSEFTSMPSLYGRVFGKALAFQPGTVNLLHVGGKVAIPKPFGPIINGQDPFEQDLTTRLGALGLAVSFVDDWEMYHANMGEVHCGTNVKRDMRLAWWESGR